MLAPSLPALFPAPFDDAESKRKVIKTDRFASVLGPEKVFPSLPWPPRRNPWWYAGLNIRGSISRLEGKSAGRRLKN